MRFLLWRSQMALCGFSAFADDDYFPLLAGQERDHRGEDRQPGWGSHVQRRFPQKNEGPVEKDGKTYFRIRAHWENLPNNPDLTTFARKDEKGVYSINGTVEKTELVLPLKIGAKWEQPSPDGTMTVTVLGIETIEVEGKSYKNCFHLRGNFFGTIYTDDFWQAPNVGLVKSENVNKDGTKLTFTLKEFRPGK